jgi:glycosyltransferase involved in cell wall biosynthesis
VPNAIIHYPVQARARPEDREQTRASLGINPEEVVILLAARMESWKGHRNLLRAAEKIRSSFPWRILIAGAPNSPAESAYFQSLQRDVASSAIANRVRFLGFRSDVPALIAASDIHCQPNETPEPFGIVFIEALQGGVPVVTYSMGGAQEILDANTAMVVEPGNIDGLAAALTKLIESRELRTRLGSAGPARAQALCDPARQMHRLADTLQAVIQRTRGVASS